MPNQKVQDSLILTGFNDRPDRAQKPMPDGLQPLGEPPRRLAADERRCWRDIARMGPHLREQDALKVEVCSCLLNQYRTGRRIPTTKIALLLQIIYDLFPITENRPDIQLVPKPEWNEFDDL